VTTPHEAVKNAIEDHALIVRPLKRDEYLNTLATAAIEALGERVRHLDRDHSPPSLSPTDWETFIDGYTRAVNDILGPSTHTSDGSPESTESAAETE
jgi:hypothetical protein